MILFDSNLLVHAHATASPFHEVARRLRDEAARGALDVCLSPQVLCEFFAVVTDERVLQPPLTPEQAGREVSAYWGRSGFRHIVPQETTIPRLFKLLTQHPVRKQQVFDAFLVATMLDNDVHTIYTQNTKDFAGFPDLHVINPLLNAVP